MYAQVFLLNQIRSSKIMWFSFMCSSNYVRSLTMKLPIAEYFLLWVLASGWIKTKHQDTIKTSIIHFCPHYFTLYVSDSSEKKSLLHNYLFSLITVPPVVVATIILKGALMLFWLLLPSRNPSHKHSVSKYPTMRVGPEARNSIIRVTN